MHLIDSYGKLLAQSVADAHWSPNSFKFVSSTACTIPPSSASAWFGNMVHWQILQIFFILVTFVTKNRGRQGLVVVFFTNFIEFLWLEE